ncbi:hypothetical protein [Haloplanus salilacus]|uniref:hypothetical protein n=1 Tax=Haloplanus salilacus TaxID=2949994 RepID=UPI0030D20A2E
MGPTAVRAAVALLVLVLVVPPITGVGGTAVGQTPPEITVSVDGSTVADGDDTLVESDPTVDVSVEADDRISVVSVRVDGTTRSQYTPNATSFEESFDLALRSGEHTLDVVVEAGGTTTTHSITVTKDDQRPYVRYTSPFETELYAPPPEVVTVNTSRITLAGNFSDVSGVTHLRILRTTTYAVGTATRTDRDVYEQSELNGSFEQSIFLGVGRNNVTAWYYDELGHPRIHRLDITVEDTAPPTLSNLTAVRTSPSELRIHGNATDNGQIRSVTLRSEDGPDSAYLVDPSLEKPDPTRRSVTFGTNVSLSPGVTAVVVNATDTAGNSVERTVTVRRNVDPELSLDPDATRFENASSVAVSGRATDGEVVSATVETVDPSSGEVIDIASLHDGAVTTDLRFDRRLDAPDGRNVTVRLRVIDSAGTEHVTSLDRTLVVETATPASTPRPTATPNPSTASSTPQPPTVTPTPVPDTDDSGVTVPLIGVTVPVPSVLGASVSLPIPVVGPIDLPLVPVAVVALVGLGAVGRARG